MKTPIYMLTFNWTCLQTRIAERARKT